MASVVTSEFVRTLRADAPPFSLIEQQSLLSRLIQAVESALGEFARDPREFIRGLIFADNKDAKRRKRIYLGLAGGFFLHVVLIVLIAVFGWRAVFVKAAPEPEYTVMTFTRPTQSINEPTIENGVANKPESPKGGDGGGGGGQRTPLPPSKGEPPPMAPTPQLVSMNPSNIPDPVLPVSPTIVGPVSPPPPPAPIGDPTGKKGEFSGGPGAGGGIGTSKGQGVGDGDGPGGGPGGRGKRGGGDAGSPNGPATESIVDFNRVGSVRGYKTWSWIRRQTAIITPEAQANKVVGTVLLRATFNADGTITDIEVVMRVDFMNEAAVDSLRRSTFHPATINGVPITVRKVPIKVDVHY